MDYHLELVTGETSIAQWMIELEVGDGIGRNIAVIHDLRDTKQQTLRNDQILLRGYKTLNLELDELPTRKTAITIAEDIALALLAASDKAKPTDTVLVVCHDGLCAETVRNEPYWQHQYRYATGDPLVVMVN